MKTETTDDDELAKTIAMLIVAWSRVETDKGAAARMARKASQAESIWIQIEAAKLFLFLGEECRQDEIACLKRASELSGEKDP